ncbi:hypothetical protein MBANPS3_012650, partial [Mucor bainieri]
MVEDEIKVQRSRDTSQRRLKKLIAVSRSALFREEDVSKSFVEKKLKHATDAETEVIMKLVRFIKPYIPSKTHYRSFAFQLPFLLMANQVLRSIGRESQVVKIMPIISPTSLKALVIDTATLFALFCSNNATRKMYLQDYSGHVIQAKGALYHKDAVFSSFFDIERLQSIAKSYGMQFSNRMHILPGLKTVRIYGTVSTMRTKPRDSKPAKAKEVAQDDGEKDDVDETLE